MSKFHGRPDGPPCPCYDCRGCEFGQHGLCTYEEGHVCGKPCRGNCPGAQDKEAWAILDPINPKRWATH